MPISNGQELYCVAVPFVNMVLVEGIKSSCSFEQIRYSLTHLGTKAQNIWITQYIFGLVMALGSGLHVGFITVLTALLP